MPLIPKVTCRRCQRQYSSLQGRCPNCGTKKAAASARTPADTASVKPGTASNARVRSNSKWQFIFGIILLACVITAVIVLISFNLDADGFPDASPTPDASAAVQTETPTTQPSPSPSPSPTPTVTSISINFYTQVISEGFMTDIGAETPLTANVYPNESGGIVTWSVENELIASVEETGNNACTVRGLSSGTTKLYAECGGIKVQITVGVR